MSTFLIKLPLADIGGSLFTHQAHDSCNDFEMRYVNCMEAYGFHQGSRKCIDFMDDLKECNLKEKRVARLKAMLAERQRQIKAKEATYAETPKPDVV